MTLLVTGGAGFIGSNFIIDWVAQSNEAIVNLDKLTYAGNLSNLHGLLEPQHVFVHGDICDAGLISSLLTEHHPRAIVHFAAESHVDRSIHDPGNFVQTNVGGTLTLLEQSRIYLRDLPHAEKDAFRFVHVSTDEVYGSLSADAPAFRETNPYQPNSPYAATKAASDHLVRAYFRTYGVPTVTTNCSNNYGPRQFPEKLIPLVIANALDGRTLPIYGDGLNVRDWIYVGDHGAALRRVLARGRPGETYNIGGASEQTNIRLVGAICDLLDELRPESQFAPHRGLIRYVTDRPGHDRRYAIDTTKIGTELGWHPKETLTTGLRKTVEWYLVNETWVADVKSGAYREWLSIQYEEARA
jgi:dTDP-glucose 4,6-dehydratase